MTEIEAAELVAILAAAFPSARIDSRTVSVYVRNLVDLDYASGHEAVNNIVRTADFFPSIASIRHEILSVNGLMSPPKEQAWLEVEMSMRRIGRNGSVDWSHPAISEAVRTMGWVNMCLSENIDVVRGQFFKVYDSISGRSDRSVQIHTGHTLTSAAQKSLSSVVKSI